MNFQTFVGTQPSPAVAGDFASANPRWSVDAGPGGLVAGALGVTVGRFAWWSAALLDANSAPAVVNNFGSGIVTGFVHREQQGLITTFLAESSNVIPAGFAMTLMSGGDFWVKNDGVTECNVGMKAYANFADGKVTFAAAGTPSTAAATGSIAANTFSVTGSINGGTLSVTAVGSGTVVPGATISGTGIATGTKVISQLSGAAGGIGTYAVSIEEQTVASTTVSGTYGTFTAASGLTGTFGVGDTLTGTGISVPTTITALGTGTGGLGTYIVDVNTVVASTAITAGTSIETKFVAMSSGLPGELVKITSHVLG